MTYVFCGIDVARCGHVASVYDPSKGEFVIDSLHFENNAKGFKALSSALTGLGSRAEVLVGFESTAHYHQVLFSFLTSMKYRCFLLIPI